MGGQRDLFLLFFVEGGGIIKKRDSCESLFAVRTGLEPVTPCVTGMYSNQLN